MKIHQLSVTYLAEQDRILVRVNTAAAEEMRLWLTRRLMLGLWPLLSKLLTKHLLKLEAAGTSLETADEDLKRMLAEFRKDEFLKQAHESGYVKPRYFVLTGGVLSDYTKDQRQNISTFAKGYITKPFTKESLRSLFYQ